MLAAVSYFDRSSFDVILLRRFSVIRRRRKMARKGFRNCIRTIDLDAIHAVD